MVQHHLVINSHQFKRSIFGLAVTCSVDFAPSTSCRHRTPRTSPSSFLKTPSEPTHLTHFNKACQENCQECSDHYHLTLDKKS